MRYFQSSVMTENPRSRNIERGSCFWCLRSLCATLPALRMSGSAPETSGNHLPEREEPNHNAEFGYLRCESEKQILLRLSVQRFFAVLLVWHVSAGGRIDSWR